MKSYLILLIWMVCIMPAYAQGLSEISMPEPDSLKTVPLPKPGHFLANPLMYKEITAGIFAEPFTLQAPAFDITPYLANNWKTEYQSFSFSGHPWFMHPPGLLHASPFLHSGTIFNQATYKLGEKIMLGGNSFGTNSIFTAPLPHPSAGQ